MDINECLQAFHWTVLCLCLRHGFKKKMSRKSVLLSRRPSWTTGFRWEPLDDGWMWQGWYFEPGEMQMAVCLHFFNAPFFNSSDLWLPVGFPQTIQLLLVQEQSAVLPRRLYSVVMWPVCPSCHLLLFGQVMCLSIDVIKIYITIIQTPLFSSPLRFLVSCSTMWKQCESYKRITLRGFSLLCGLLFWWLLLQKGYWAKA